MRPFTAENTGTPSITQATVTLPHTPSAAAPTSARAVRVAPSQCPLGVRRRLSLCKRRGVDLCALCRLRHGNEAPDGARKQSFHGLQVLPGRKGALLDGEVDSDLHGRRPEVSRCRGRPEDLVEGFGGAGRARRLLLRHAPLRATAESSAPTRAKLPATLKSPIMAV